MHVRKLSGSGNCVVTSAWEGLVEASGKSHTFDCCTLLPPAVSRFVATFTLKLRISMMRKDDSRGQELVLEVYLESNSSKPHAHARMHPHAYTRIHICTHTYYTYALTHAYIYHTLTHAHTPTYILTCIYTHTHMHSRKQL